MLATPRHLEVTQTHPWNGRPSRWPQGERNRGRDYALQHFEVVQPRHPSPLGGRFVAGWSDGARGGGGYSNGIFCLVPISASTTSASCLSLSVDVHTCQRDGQEERERGRINVFRHKQHTSHQTPDFLIVSVVGTLYPPYRSVGRESLSKSKYIYCLDYIHKVSPSLAHFTGSTYS
jgi:hypothetical protein